MRKIIYLLIAGVLFLGCKKEEEKKSSLTQAQKNTLKVFYGTFKSNYGIGDYYQQIHFLNKYDPPLVYVYKNEYENILTAQIYGNFEYYNDANFKRETYYYNLDTNGQDMKLYVYNIKDSTFQASTMQYEKVIVLDDNTLQISEKNFQVPNIFRRE
jgi:hypothetical protein